MNNPDYTVERIPGAFQKSLVFIAPIAIPILVCAALGIILQDAHPEIAHSLGIVFVILIALGIFRISSHRPASRPCPRCNRIIDLDGERTASGTYGMTCEHCKIIWDLGYGTA